MDNIYKIVRQCAMFIRVCRAERFEFPSFDFLKPLNFFFVSIIIISKKKLLVDFTFESTVTAFLSNFYFLAWQIITSTKINTEL